MNSPLWPTRLALSAATRRARDTARPVPPRERLAYSAAKTEAPWSASHAKRLPTPDLEREYREAYADELVRLKIARPKGAKAQGRSGRADRLATRVTWEPTVALFTDAADRAAAAGKSLNLWLTDVVTEKLRPPESIQIARHVARDIVSESAATQTAETS